MTREGPPIEIRGTPGIVEVDLPETPTSGYVWEIAAAPSGIEERGRDFREESREPIAGGSGLRTFKFDVPTPGAYEVAFELKRPWEAEALERRTVRLVIA
ncbi:MAG TPA: protease inhibitor I42 family protein [Candidatus Limnocylindrales bacterium]|jgi:predicted secreted protein